MLLDTRNKNIYGLCVGMSTVFNISEHLRFKETTLYGHDLHTIRCYLTQETRIYVLWVGIPIVFEILGPFLFQGDGTTIYGHDIHTVRCYLTQETRIYIVSRWDLNGL
jgi:hypothetical protein